MKNRTDVLEESMTGVQKDVRQIEVLHPASKDSTKNEMLDSTLKANDILIKIYMQ